MNFYKRSRATRNILLMIYTRNDIRKLVYALEGAAYKYGIDKYKVSSMIDARDHLILAINHFADDLISQSYDMAEWIFRNEYAMSAGLWIKIDIKRPESGVKKEVLVHTEGNSPYIRQDVYLGKDNMWVLHPAGQVKFWRDIPDVDS